MLIKDEYIFWVIEKITKNLNLLISFGLDTFTFILPCGNSKLADLFDYFPNIVDSEKMNTYTLNDVEYKREILATPNIVFYINKDITSKRDGLKDLLDTIVSLFPDEMDLTTKHPKFNIRISRNLFLSIDGNNQGKFNRNDYDKKNMPFEYNKIIEKCATYDKVTCDLYNNISLRLTDHHILKWDGHNSKCVPNNIISHYNLLKSFSKPLTDTDNIPKSFDSFEEFFAELNLLSYYNTFLSKYSPALTKIFRKDPQTQTKIKFMNRKSIPDVVYLDKSIRKIVYIPTVNDFLCNENDIVKVEYTNELPIYQPNTRLSVYKPNIYKPTKYLLETVPFANPDSPTSVPDSPKYDNDQYRRVKPLKLRSTPEERSISYTWEYNSYDELQQNRLLKYNKIHYQITWTPDLTNYMYITTDNCNNTYNDCILEKYGYQIDFPGWLDSMKFLHDHVYLNIKTPTFNPDEPYIFNLIITILKSKYNLFNIYCSCNILSHIQTKIFLLLQQFSPGPSKYTFILHNSSLTHYIYDNGVIPYSYINLQMVIKNEYIFWVIEKITKNLELLKSNGLDTFKLMLPCGNTTLRGIYNYFPHNDSKKINITYTLNGVEYKTEILHAANIVFYINKDILSKSDGLKKLIDIIVSLFPDEMDLTTKHPGFTVRLSSNLFLYMGADKTTELINYDKKYIPVEYTKIIERCAKYDKEQCNYYNNISLRLTDHHILKWENDKCVPNNIISYYNSLRGFESEVNYKDQLSFDALFKFFNLESYYNKLILKR
jgi:hypothetical protein